MPGPISEGYQRPPRLDIVEDRTEEQLRADGDWPDDILVRLRYHTATLDRVLCTEAAAEIERLRAALIQARSDFHLALLEAPDASRLERLREARDKTHAAIGTF